MKEALVILGMHRSGTSFLASCMKDLGYRVPRDRQPGAEDNRFGHFEPAAVVRLNDRLLRQAGGRWDQGFALDPDRLPQLDPDDAVAALSESFGRYHQVVLKDPRMSLTFGLWRPILEELGIRVRCLIALRHPAAVARSLAHRNAAPAALSTLAWAAHLKGALTATEGLPRSLAVFPDWISNPPASLTRIAADLGLDGVNLGAAARRMAQRYSAPDRHCDDGGGSTIPGLAECASAFEALRAGARDRDAFTGTAERLWRDLEPFRSVLEPVDAHRLREIKALAADLGAVAADEAQRRSPDERLRAELAQVEGARRHWQAEAGRHALSLRKALADRDAQERQDAKKRARCAKQAARASRRLAAARAAGQALQARAAQGAKAARAASRYANRLSKRLSEQARELAELKTTLSKREALVGALMSDLDAEKSRAEDLAKLLQDERMTVLRPIYRRIYRAGGSFLRRVIPARHVERLKRLLPTPEGIPAALSLPPVSCCAQPAIGTCALRDLRFRARAQSVFQEKLANAGLIMVSHAPAILREHCDSAILLHGGQAHHFADLEEALAMQDRLMRDG